MGQSMWDMPPMTGDVLESAVAWAHRPGDPSVLGQMGWDRFSDRTVRPARS